MLFTARRLGFAGMVFSILLVSCRPYYLRQKHFLDLVQQERFEEAEAELASSRKAKKKEKHKLLYTLNRGYTAFQQGQWAESNRWFMQADRLIEDYRKNLGYEALSFLVNPGVKPYKAEDFESVLMHYFNTIAFLKQRNFESALVETRRMNLSLQDMYFSLSDKPKYKADAFGHLLMGLTHEASGDVNNAFIAYRNAWEIYKTDYLEYFNCKVPEQLKIDLVRTAHFTGFKGETEFFRKEFGWPADRVIPAKPEAELILFWQNGLGPVKDQWSIDFSITNQAGQLLFTDPASGLQFNFPVTAVNPQDAANLSDLKVFRIAFPRYVSRPQFYQSGSISVHGATVQLELAEPIEAIAPKSLRDRFAREMANALLRLAVKKAAEYALRKENKDAGAVLGIANALTEQADTRNWQTLPATISYARIPLKAGENKVALRFERTNNRPPLIDTLCVEAVKGRTYVEVYSTIKP